MRQPFIYRGHELMPVVLTGWCPVACGSMTPKTAAIVPAAQPLASEELADD